MKCFLRLAGFGVNKESKEFKQEAAFWSAEMCISASSADKINATWARLLNV